MGLASSTFTVGPPQADGRHYVSEVHTEADGREFKYDWLSDGTLDPQDVAAERAIVINSQLSARSAARLAVVGTEIPYSKHDFLSRFSLAERIAIREEAKTNPVVLDFMEMLNASGGVYMTLARPGITYLQSLGKITADRAAIIGAD